MSAMSGRSHVRFALFMALLGAAVFLPAGTFDWVGGWVFLGETAVGAFAIALWLAFSDPELLAERIRGGVRDAQAPWDKIFLGFLRLALPCWIVLMGLDAKRWGLSHMPVWLNLVGAIFVAAFFVVCWLVFRENSFAAPVVKIQRERGQSVVTTGPYRFVRHPMYSGAILSIIGTPLLLGSWIGLALAPVFVVALALRIGGEERMLRDGLPGYADYMRRVRYRLAPGLW